jgi:hypothetical protein
MLRLGLRHKRVELRTRQRQQRQNEDRRRKRAVKKTVQSPAEIVIAWRKFCSASGPEIILMTTGTVGNS